jgi:hypothetical protein
MKRLLAALFSLFLVSNYAWADGPGPSRKMTDVESASFGKVRAAVQEALPKPPGGYAFALEYQSDFDEGTIPQALAAKDMFRMTYQARYTRDQSGDGQQMMTSLMDRAKGTPEQQAKMAELNARDEQLTETRDKAKSPTEKDRIRTELKAVRAESDKLSDEIAAGYEEWVASGGAANAMQNATSSLPAKELTVRVLINADESLSEKAVPFAMDGGYPAYELPDGCAGTDFYCITVFLGRFEKIKKNAGYTYFQLQNADLGVPTKARGMVVTFTGPKDKPEAVRDFVRGTNWAGLKALLP